MRKLLLILVALIIVSIPVFAQGTGSVINDLNNFPYLRTAFQNAENLGGSGTHAFVTTAVADSVTGVYGLTATSIVVVVPRANVQGAGTVLAQPVAGDVLNCAVGGSGTGAGTGVVGTIYVNRVANTTSGLSYNWFVIKY